MNSAYFLRNPNTKIGLCHPATSRRIPTYAANALVEMGDSLKQMADVKYSLDDNIKQNFLEPLHQLQTKDLKEVMVSSFVFPFWDRIKLVGGGYIRKTKSVHSIDDNISV